MGKGCMKILFFVVCLTMVGLTFTPKAVFANCGLSCIENTAIQKLIRSEAAPIQMIESEASSSKQNENSRFFQMKKQLANTYPIKQYLTKKSMLIKKIITYPEPADEIALKSILQHISRIPMHMLNRLHEAEVEIRLVEHPITQEPEYAHLQGVVPKGWEGLNKTWDDIPGIGGNPVVIRMGYSDFNQGHGSINLELHEIAHAVNTYVFDSASKTAEFKRLTDEEMPTFIKQATNRIDVSYFSDSTEYFAEAFAFFYKSEETKKTLEQYAPRTYVYFEKLHRKKRNKIGEL